MQIFPAVRNDLMAMFVVASVLSPVNARAGSIYYDVVIDTSSFSGQSGDIDFQLGGDANNLPVMATISRYNSDAVLHGHTTNQSTAGEPAVTVTGDLRSDTLSLYNDDSAFQIADADQFVSSFGTVFEFRVTLTGDGIGVPSPGTASLAIALFDGSGKNSFFSGPDSTNNAAVFIQTSTDGSSSLTQYPPTQNSVPEPSSLISMLVGALGIGVGMYRRRQLAV
jgi:hypothetical protein